MRARSRQGGRVRGGNHGAQHVRTYELGPIVRRRADDPRGDPGDLRALQARLGPERRRGIASALTEQGIAWAKHAGCGSVWVDALDQFGDAAKLLKKLGFSESGVLHRHYFGVDVRLFEKLL
jgi:GNAT superfamily N-acetyltransferase